MKSLKQILLDEFIKYQIGVIESNFKKIRYNFVLLYMNRTVLCEIGGKVSIQKYRMN